MAVFGKRLHLLNVSETIFLHFEAEIQIRKVKPAIVGKTFMFECKVLRVLRQEDLLTLNQNTKMLRN